MSQDDTPDAPTANTAPKVAPESMTLRSQPRPVTRLNRRTLAFLTGGLGVAVIGATFWSLQPHRHSGNEPTELYNVDRVTRSEELDQLPKDYSGLPAKPAPAASVPALGPPLPGDLGPAIVQSQQSPPLPNTSPGQDPQAAERDRLRQEAEAAAGSSVFFRTSNQTGGQHTAVALAASAAAPAAGNLSAFTGPASTAAQPNDPTAVQNRQSQKEAFLAKSGDSATSNSGTLQTPTSPYTVMAGTVIPAALVTGINSDLPGSIIAEVTQPVYDTATGRYLLIPQGSRLIGRYDSQVAFGQRRMLLVWLRLVLPDASSIALDKLPGIDPAGYAGLEDGVDWHWGRILAGAALSTLLGVSSEMAMSNQGNLNNGNTVLALRDSAQDTANQVGQEITRRNLSVQPTLTARPGLPVEVMVNKDMILRPYQPLFFQRGSSQ
ncbi:TrbI/VirB10 family protein [Burkholderia vietnamiensis]|uniref:TrbI/VirB10 family protein n=1 Tax=Burkholderia vietnamiensis TaxID=60552 RepID=UPI001ADB2785|nr:TrbI/VirB10 family protein [Burkholderia vietnamiensis]QTK83494.1 TrbI/VirB10 family protein [Burkholderia vietnamiensis]